MTSNYGGTVRRLANPLARRSLRPGTLYNGCTCCCCCCILMPIGNFIAVASSHDRSKAVTSYWWHLFVNIVCCAISIGLGWLVAGIGLFGRGDTGFYGAIAVAVVTYLALLQASAGLWIPATIAADRRFLVVGLEWLLSVVLMAGFGAMSIYIVVKGFMR